MHLSDHGFVGEDVVDAGFDFYMGRARAYLAHTVADECFGHVGVVDVTGVMMDIEDLVSPSDGTKMEW